MGRLPKLIGFVNRAKQEVAHKPMFSRLDKDIPAGIVVFLVALPLCLGIALASGAPLISGLISGVIGGLVIGFISKSGTSVSGPAASVSAVVLIAIQELGSFEVFLVALFIAGIFQIIIGTLKAGIIADYMPQSIIKGLLAAIGIILIFSQLPYAFGFEQDKSQMLQFDDNFFEYIHSVLLSLYNSVTAGAVFLTLLSLFILIFWEKTILKKIKLLPPALVVVILGVVINLVFKFLLPGLHLDGIHLVNIPRVDNLLTLFTFPDFTAIWNKNLWIAALTIGVIASISTLLNIEATDNIDSHKRRTPPNRELIAQGIGNSLAGLLGGIAITSVIVRSSVNIEAGGETKLSTILHGLLLLLSVTFLSTLLNLIPLASLAAILIVVGYKLASLEVVKSIFKKGLDQFLPFIVTIIAILMTDVLIGVLIGSALSIFFLLRSNYYNPFFIENSRLIQGEFIKLELSNEVSFLNKPSIKNTLWSVPDNSKVIIDATFSSYIDQDIIEVLQDFKNTFAKDHGIEVSIIGLKEAYNLGEEIDFMEKSLEKVKEKTNPQEILDYLKEGNLKYITGNLVSKRLRNKELSEFLKGAPLATVVNCIDMREPLNMLLNTGIGDLIPLKAAGNVISQSLVQSIEVTCREQGAKLILFMGNSDNTFIKKALKDYLSGNSSELEYMIRDALQSGKFSKSYLQRKDIEILADEISQFNIKICMHKTVAQSPHIMEMMKADKVGLATGYFDRKTAKVTFSNLFTEPEKGSIS